MSDEKKCCCGCQKEEKPEAKPEECSPEQIKECHGDQPGHPCERNTEE